MSPEHAARVPMRIVPGCHYGLVSMIAAPLVGFNPAAGQMEWDAYDQIWSDITTYRDGVFLPQYGNLLRAADRGENVEMFIELVEMVQRQAEPRRSIVMRVGALSETAGSPRRNQISNPTSIRACATVSTRVLRLCFESSTRANDSSKNHPNRLRFDRAREVSRRWTSTSSRDNHHRSRL